MKNKYVKFLLAVCLLTVGCSTKISFNVELDQEQGCIPLSRDLWNSKRPVYQGYAMLAVEKKDDDHIVPAKHYRVKHDRFLFESKFNRDDISFRKTAFLINNKLIVEKPSGQMGLAIKGINQEHFRVYWFSENDISKIENYGELTLPDCESLPEIKQIIDPYLGSMIDVGNHGYSYSVRLINDGGLPIGIYLFRLSETADSRLSFYGDLSANQYYIDRYFHDIPVKKINIKWSIDHEPYTTEVSINPPNEFNARNGRAINFYYHPEKKQITVSYDIFDEKTGEIYEVSGQ